MLAKGLQKFGRDGMQAATKEMEQMHNHKCFEPINIEELNMEEKRRLR